MATEPRTMFVTGDVTIDWLLLPGDGERGVVDFIWMWGGDYSCRALVSAGGAASHADILRRTVEASGRGDLIVRGPRLPRKALASPFHPGYPHTFARIQRFPRRLGEAGQAWRIREFLGTDMTRAEASAPNPAGRPEGRAATAQGEPRRWPRRRIDTLTIVDHAVGYRERCADLPALLAAEPRDIVWQTGAPLVGSRLAELLLGEHADCLTAITSSDELRKSGAEVGYPLSWEQITEEIVAAVQRAPPGAARRVIVIIGASGAVIVERDADAVLVLRPSFARERLGAAPPGVGAGYGRCIDAAVALGLAGGGEPSLLDSVKRGLAAARAAHVAGLQVDGSLRRRRSPFPLGEVARPSCATTRSRRRGVPAQTRTLDPGSDLRRNVPRGGAPRRPRCTARQLAARHPRGDHRRLVVGRPRRDRGTCAACATSWRSTCCGAPGAAPRPAPPCRVRPARLRQDLRRSPDGHRC